MVELERFRSRIDSLDGVLISLLSERFRNTRLIGSVKKSVGLQVEDLTREEELRSWVLTLSDGKLEPEFLDGFMSQIFEHAKSEQECSIGAVPSHPSIDSLRSEIEALDGETTKNFVERFCVTREVGHFKAQNNLNAVDPDRERKQLGRATLLAARAPEYDEWFFRRGRLAATAMVARRIGQKDTEAAGVAASQSILLGMITPVPITVVGVLFSEQLLSALGAQPSVAAIGFSYCAVTLASSSVVIQFFLIGAIFRGAGDAVVAMRTLWLANALNIILDPLLIFGLGPVPGLGLKGAAIASTLARGIGLLIQLRILFSGSGRLHVKLSDMRPDSSVIRRLVRIALPGVLQRVISTSAWLGLIRIIAVFGSSALAGYTIALRITILALLPSWGMANAAATLVGQNLGAGKADRAERSVWLAGYSNTVFLGLLTIVFISWSESIVGIFTPEPDVIAVGATHLRYVSGSYLFLAFGMVILQAFNGAGDTWTPTWINFICNWLLQVPLAYLLSIYFGMGIGGCFIAIAVAYVTAALVSVIAFRRGKWKERKI